MSAYLIVQIKIIRQQGWPEYRHAVGPLTERFGGRYIVRGADVEVPYAMAIDTSHPGHDQETVRSWASERLKGVRPFMIPQTRPFLVAPCRTFEDALGVAYRFSKTALARETPWKSGERCSRR
jgi:hypothetical protein